LILKNSTVDFVSFISYFFEVNRKLR